MSGAPLKSALKKTSASSVPESGETSAAAPPPPAAAVDAAAAARIRAAAEEKASQLHQTARAQAQWREWVSRVQEKLIEPSASASTMQRAAMVLRPEEYEEVVEERVSARLCAYPSCGVTVLPSATPKKFHLSLRQQRVYDVSNAQQFCSEACFIGSEVYKTTLHDEPFYLRQMAKKTATKTTLAPAAGTRPTTAAAAANKEATTSEAAADPSAAPLLPIVEKDASVSHTFPKVSSADATANALAVEGYRPKSAVLPAAHTTSKHTANSEQQTAETNPAPALPASGARPPATTAASPAPLAPPPATPAPSVSFALPEPPTGSPTEFLDFTPLPSVMADVIAKETAREEPLSRAAFESLSPEEQIDYMALMALQERKNMNGSGAASASASTMASPPRPTAPAGTAKQTTSMESAEKKLRRRKTTAEKEQAKGSPVSPAPSSLASPAAAAAASVSTPSPTPARRVLSSADLLCDDDSDDPIITPSEIKSNVTAIRNLTLSPFLGVLQAVMRWTTPATGHFVRTGTMPTGVLTPAAANRQRQSAFLAMVQQHWTPLASALQVHRPCARELRDLTDTFSFDDAVPPLRAEQWRIVTIMLMQGVAHRLGLDEGDEAIRAATADTTTTAPATWTCIQCISAMPRTLASPSALQTALLQILKHSGFGADQVDSIYQQWMMQTVHSYGQ